MALLLDNIKDVPQTHVLIIGVGNYPYLKNGVLSHHFEQDYLNDLEQLSSPPVSAAFLYEQFKQMDAESWFTPEVGSIEVLVDEGVIPAHTHEEPTRKNIEKAYFRWKDRCNTHEDNVAVFYFAGHGLGLNEQCLLPKDFGENKRVPFRDAIALDGSVIAFRNCRAKTQIFLVDACRQIPTETLFGQIAFTPLDHVGSIMLPESPFTLIMKAASNNESSYGKKDSPSFFISALVKGMRSYGAVNTGQAWTVETGDLMKGINGWLEMEEPSRYYRQRCFCSITGSYPLLTLPGPPQVDMNLNCMPSEALPLAKLSYANLRLAAIAGSRPPEKVPWKVSIPAGIYSLRAEFAARDYHAEPVIEAIHPKSANQIVLCQKVNQPDTIAVSQVS